MPHWLARERRGQESAPFKRFAAPFWTVNFPRPMMASVVTTAPDALRVDAVFYHSDELAGLIWESEDRWDHPLLGYETRRDYAHCRLSFRWRSGGVMPLDAINGPTLTIEGRDAEGHARAWYVRLWNYAEGSPEDALVTLDFDALDGGFLLPGEADRVWPHDIDRLFVSIVPPGYDPVATPFATGREAWVELSDIVCDGSGSMLSIGDIMVPEHRLRIATGYDDGYNQTPERVLRQIEALGYRETIVHYVGMSHYFRLERSGAGLYASLAGGAVNAPCAAWHADFLARAKAMGFGVILSLSYELFDAHCWNDWKQRTSDGAPALTGWVPPSTLLSPAHGGAMAYLRAVAGAFVALALAKAMPVRFQIGEPWWWVTFDGKPCLYDDAARAAFGGSPPVIAHVGETMDAGRIALLDAAGALLAASTAALAAHVRAAAPGAEILVLVYLPTVLDPQAPEMKRANVPLGWAAPAFDRLQVEDYDWVTDGHVARSRAARAVITQRLGYPQEEQHYFAGFVLDGAHPSAPVKWERIAEAARVSLAGGDAATVLWALPQVARDGFTWFTLEGEAEVQHFDDVRFPLDIGRRASVAPTFSTQTIEAQSGHEQRSSDWADARMQFDAGPGVRSDADLASLIAFFRARRGAARGFRFTDPYDHSSAPFDMPVSAIDQRIGTGDGTTTRFELVKHYGDGDDPQTRRITRPVAGSVRVAVDGVEPTPGAWEMGELGAVLFDDPPPAGSIVTAGYLFDVPVRFATDSIEISAETWAAGEVPSVPLVEVRE